MMIRGVAYLVLAIGLLLLGGLLGHRLTPPTVVAGPSLQVPDSVEVTELDSDPAEDLMTMPDVVGLDEETALRVLRDAGLEEEVTSTERGSPGRLA